MKVRPQISYTTKNAVYDVVSAIERVKPSLKKLDGISPEILEKETGLSLISQNGMRVIDNNREITISTDDMHSYRIQEQKQNNIVTDIFVKNDFIESSKGIEKAPNAIDNFLQTVCELFDFPILKLRKLLNGDNIGALFKKYALPGQLNQANTQLVNEIKSLVQETENSLKDVESTATRSYIKKSYPNIKPNVQLLKRIDFAGIGKGGEDYSIQILNDRLSKPNVVIRVTDTLGETKNIIIEPEGKVLKTKNLSSKCNLGGKSTYYLQEELDSQEFQEHLHILRDELKKYNAYILERITKRDNYVAKNSTSTVGTLDNETQNSIKSIHEKYDRLRIALHKLKEPFRKEMAKEKLHIGTITGDSTIILKARETIRLSFPPLKGAESAKILVLDENENIIRSYCIQDSKLVKFNPTNVKRGKLSHTINHYHTQEEIDNSGLKDDLIRIERRLNNMIDIMSTGREWYRS